MDERPVDGENDRQDHVPEPAAVGHAAGSSSSADAVEPFSRKRTRSSSSTAGDGWAATTGHEGQVADRPMAGAGAPCTDCHRYFHARLTLDPFVNDVILALDCCR